jgi:hypothetical protein
MPKQSCNDRDSLTAEFPFSTDLKEAILEHRPMKLSKEELQEQKKRVREWVEAYRVR